MVTAMRSSALLAAAVAAALILPAAAFGANPIPGAHYEGTTDTGSPFSFDVAPDGASVTNVVFSTPMTCVGPDGGVQISAIVSKTPFPVSGGSVSGKDDVADPWFDAFAGTFSSANEAAGTFTVMDSRFTLGEGVTSCNRSGTWTARSGAAAPAATQQPQTPAAGTPAAAAPAVRLGAPKRVRLAGALRSGFAVPATLAAAAAPVTAQAVVSAKEAKRLKLGRRAVVLATARVARAAAGTVTLKFRPRAAVVRKLRRARSVKVALRVTTKGVDGATSTASSVLTLRR
jgi:hypothetical protein